MSKSFMYFWFYIVPSSAEYKRTKNMIALKTNMYEENISQ